MMQLTSRQKSLLLVLAKCYQAIRVKTIADNLKCSERIVRYDLMQVEEYLKEKNIRMLKKPRVGIQLVATPQQKEELINELQADFSNAVIMSRSERKETICLLLLFATENLTLEKIADKIGVSRQTVVNDIEEAKKYFSEHQLQLSARKGLGTYVDGNELTIRKLMAKVIMANFADSALFNKVNFNTENLLTYKSNCSFRQGIIIEYLAQQNLDLIAKEIKTLQSACNFYMDDKDLLNFIIDVVINLQRCKSGHVIEKQLSVHAENQREYLVASTLAKQLKQKNIADLNEDEIASLVVVVIDCNIKFTGGEIDLQDDQLSEVVEDMLAVLTENHKYQMSGYFLDKLKQSLISHLRLTIKKYRLRLVSSNALLVSLKQNYSEVFGIAQKMADIFEQKTHIPLNEDELGFITIHIVANFEQYSSLLTKTAIIVCNTDTDVAKVLCNRIRSNIPRLIIKDVRAYLDSEDSKTDLEDVDFIISTFQIPDPGKPVFIVSPIISAEEIDHINRYINGKVMDKQPDNSDLNLLVNNLISNYVSTEDAKEFKDELSKVLNIEGMMEDCKRQMKIYGLSSSLIVAGICTLIFEGQSKFRYEIKNDRLCGMIIHIMMQIPNWKNQESSYSYNNESFKQENIEVYTYLVSALKEMSKEFNILIPEEEALSIMHYIL